MSTESGTLKVKPWGKDQGEFVLINAEDFDPKQHEAFEPKEDPKPKKAKKEAPAS